MDDDADSEEQPRKKRVDLEGPIHRSILAYLRRALPGAIIHHSANEIGISGKEAARQVAKAKSLGMVPGFPDLVVFLTADVGPLFFEVKAKGGTLTQSQRDVIAALDALGYRVAMVRSIDDVAARLRDWGIKNAVDRHN